MILCGKTDVGEKRNTNQDTFAVRMIIPQVSLGVVCDGMGGANGGNIASTIARDVFVGQIESFFIRVQARPSTQVCHGRRLFRTVGACGGCGKPRGV